MYAIICATDEEFAAIHRRFRGEANLLNGFAYYSAMTNDHPDLVYVQTGIGKVNAAMTATRLLTLIPDIQAVIFAGVAGAVYPELKTGDIVLAHKFTQHDYGARTPEGHVLYAPGKLPIGPAPSVRFLMDKASGEEFDNLRYLQDEVRDNVKGRVEIGTIVTGDVFMSSAKDTKWLHEVLQADAVDMESHAVVQVCREFRKPVYILRSISDNAGDDAATSYEQMAEVMAVDITYVAATLLTILENR